MADKRIMKKIFVGVSAAIVVGGILVMTFLINKKEEAVDTLEVEAQAVAREPAAEPTPLIRYPVVSPEPELEAEAPVTEPVKKPDVFMIREVIPDLAESDASLLRVISSFIDVARVRSLFYVEQVINRFVATVDNLSSRNLNGKQLLSKPVKNEFLVTRDKDGRIFIHEKNAKRYTLYVDFLEAMDINKLVTVYIHFYPLFQQAYEELGFPGRYFNDRLIYTIDHLLDTPVVAAPIELKQPAVMYIYADSNLEKLSAGQRILLRMGPENANRVKAVLQNLRSELLSRINRRR